MPAPGRKFSLPLLVALTIGPALIVGAGLWLLADFVPQCTPDLREDVTSPDGAATLAVFGLDCGAQTGTNTQAAIHPAAEPFSPDNAEVFFAADGTHELSPRWREGTIMIDAPEGATITRQLDRVGSFPVAYD
jgi:hypothetical protein